ncbi:MAG: hypothetical protein NTW49_12210 [Bacteroidia bacterium]|nr:hypothetical protein [Bacteroidia bacterium]
MKQPAPGEAGAIIVGVACVINPIFWAKARNVPSFHRPRPVLG